MNPCGAVYLDIECRNEAASVVSDTKKRIDWSPADEIQEIIDAHCGHIGSVRSGNRRDD
jgi:hypothetical protein